MAFTDVTTGARVIREGFGLIKITLAGDCKTGDLLGYSSGWKQADADGSIYPKLIAGETAESTEIITAYAMARISGITTGTAGNPLYLSDTAGGYSATASSTISQIVGFELGGGEMFIRPADYVEFRQGSSLPALTLAGAIAGGDQSFTGVGNMTFTNGSILASGSTSSDTLLFRANDTTLITLATGTVDTLTLGAVTLSGTVTCGDVAMNAVGDMTFTDGSILASGTSSSDTLILRANDTAFITFTTGTTDECELEACTMKGTWLADGTVTLPAFTAGGDITVSTQDFISDTTTGTKIGTGATQKFGFFNKTPVVQQAHIADATTSVAGHHTTINAVLTLLETYGLAVTS